jgi:hypothetical protein
MGRWLGAVASVVATAALLTVLPGPAGDQFRRAVHLPQHRVVPTVETTRTGAFAFEHTQRGTSTPVSYNPCRRIHYVINPNGGPSGSASFIQAAVAEASRRSGFGFTYDGTRTDRSFHRLSGPVLIGFAWPDELDQMPENGDAVGLGGSVLVDDGDGFDQYRTGMVALKESWFRRQDAQGNTAAEQAVVMHELGHVLGLAHVDDPGELMYPSVTRTTYGPGDLEGLARLGAVRC